MTTPNDQKQPTSIVLRHKSLSPDPTLPTLAVMMPVGAGEESNDPATELATIMVRFLVTIYAKQEYGHEAAMRLFSTCFIAASAMSSHIRPVDPFCAPLGQDFLVDMDYDYTVSTIGDKIIGTPTILLTVFKPALAEVPAGEGTETVMAWPNEGGEPPPESLAGTLKLTMTHGMVVVSDATGWLGTKTLLDWLSEKYNAALA